MRGQPPNIFPRTAPAGVLYATVSGTKKTRNPKVIWEEPYRHPSRQRAAESPLVTMGCATFNPKIAPSLRRSPPPSNIPSSTDPTLPETASRSIQPFCHSIPSGPTDRPTDRPTDGIHKSVPTTAYALSIVGPIATRLNTRKPKVK